MDTKIQDYLSCIAAKAQVKAQAEVTKKRRHLTRNLIAKSRVARKEGKGDEAERLLSTALTIRGDDQYHQFTRRCLHLANCYLRGRRTYLQCENAIHLEFDYQKSYYADILAGGVFKQSAIYSPAYAHGKDAIQAVRLWVREGNITREQAEVHQRATVKVAA